MKVSCDLVSVGRSMILICLSEGMAGELVRKQLYCGHFIHMKHQGSHYMVYFFGLPLNSGLTVL